MENLQKQPLADTFVYTTLLKRVSSKYCDFLKNSLFYRGPRVVDSESTTLNTGNSYFKLNFNLRNDIFHDYLDFDRRNII